MKKSNIKLLAVFILVTILSAISLTACSAPELSADYKEAEVKTAAENVVILLNAQDSEGLRAMFTEQMNTAITDDVFVQIYAAIEGGGTFESIQSVNVVGSTDKSTGEEFATAVAIAKYENKSFTYTITFNKKMQLAGLYYK
jgi:predicted methyltransferase